jgi:histidine ammonia-lyase
LLGFLVVLAKEALTRMDESVMTVREAVRTERVSYGINTGFGALATANVRYRRRRNWKTSMG